MPPSKAKSPSPDPRSPITYSWVYPIVLTHRCVYECGYCPLPVSAGPELPSKAVMREAMATSLALGLHQVKVTGGEGVENQTDIASAFRFYGFRSFTDYVKSMLAEIGKAGDDPPLFPELDLGTMSLYQLQRLRPSLFTLRLFLDTMDPDLQYGVAHARSEGKWPEKRIEGLVSAGRLKIPVNSGMMLGIGESPKSRIKTLETLAELFRRYAHIQSVTIRPFEPQPRTPMSHLESPKIDVVLETIAAARRILPARVAISFPITFCPEHVLDIVNAGASDLGEFELQSDHHKNARAVNAYYIVEDRLKQAAIPFADRLSIFPRFATSRWLLPHFQEQLRALQRGRAAAPKPGESRETA